MAEINIQLTNICQLHCNWCANKWHFEDNDITKMPFVMPTSTFINIVDKCVDAGITEFCLTPMLGEPFIDDEIREKCEYLERHPKVEKYFMATNLLRSPIFAFGAFQPKKLHLEISVYGYDRKSYLENTNSDMFNTFMNLFLLQMRKHSYTQTVYIRFPEEIPQMFRQVLTMYEQNGHTVSYEETHNFNWGGKMPCSIANQHPTSQKKGVCPTAQTGCIFRNGDFGLCYMNDVEESTTFGNIFETPLSEILASDKYMKVLKDMERNIYTGICENCNEKW